MAKRRKKGFDSIVEMVDGFLREFQAESDRGTAIVASAYLDDLLAAMLRKPFVDPKKVDQLIEGQGGLETFACRIRLAFRLGLIRTDQFEDLNTLRKIRSKFAHSHQPMPFSDPPLCNYCDDLTQLARMARFGNQMSPEEQDILVDRYKTRRQKFIGNTVHLVVGLMTRAAGLVHAEVGGTITSDGTKLPFEKSGA